MEDEREIKLSIEEFEAVLKKAEVIASEEVLYSARTEPDQLVIKVLR
jgi:hypothetical protein